MAIPMALRFTSIEFHLRKIQYSKIKNVRTLSSAAYNLVTLLNISESKAEHMCAKHPVITKLSRDRLSNLLQTLSELHISTETLLEEPSLFGILPITLKNRYKVLEESGFKEISPNVLLSYLNLVKYQTIGDLKRSNLIESSLNLENKLAGYLTKWPTSLTSSIYGDVNESTIHKVRLKIIQRYLELVLELTKDEFYRGVDTYPTIKHRPLQSIRETLRILQSVIMMPDHKLKSNLYLIHCDPENLKKILFDLKSIGGIDIKEVIRLRPKLACKNYTILLEIKKILEEYSISDEAQIRCFDIYTLGPETVRKRLDEAKEMPEFNTFYQHPRFLKIIHYKNTAMKRILNLNNKNKKCVSLNILSGSSAHYDNFEKAPGDRLGKGKDLIFCISECLEKKYSNNDIRKKINKHQFWFNIPIVQVKFVYQKLSREFSMSDIYENCTILLYPWMKINETLNYVKTNNKVKSGMMHENLDTKKISNSQKLSLALYLLERNHYFSGNGVWMEEKNKINVIPEKIQVAAY